MGVSINPAAKKETRVFWEVQRSRFTTPSFHLEMWEHQASGFKSFPVRLRAQQIRSWKTHLQYLTVFVLLFHLFSIFVVQIENVNIILCLVTWSPKILYGRLLSQTRYVTDRRLVLQRVNMNQKAVLHRAMGCISFILIKNHNKTVSSIIIISLCVN